MPTRTSCRLLHRAPLLGLLAAAVAACAPAHRAAKDAAPLPADASADSAAAGEGATPDAGPSLSELYPSLGDEDTQAAAPANTEIDQEQQAEESFLDKQPATGENPGLDPKSLAAEFDIPVEVTPSVEQFIEYFQTSGRRWYATWLARSTRYLPMMKRVFRENGLPEDLCYLAMIESGFSNKAWSRAKASGPWQFIRETGSQYGLSDDWWVDERRDPELATRAAAQLLKDLYEQFGDWYLAAAAYNAGAGKIDNAIERYHTRNFWELCAGGRYLRTETKHYVPKLLAAAIIAKNPAKFGFTGIDWMDPLDYETVTVPDATDLKVVSDCAGADLDSVAELNPSLKRFCTPPGATSFEVRVPKGTAVAFADAYTKIDPSKRVTFRRHTVHSGDTLSKIARLYGTDGDGILRINHLASARSLRVGNDLVIPVPSGIHVGSGDGTKEASSDAGAAPVGVVARLTVDHPAPTRPATAASSQSDDDDDRPARAEPPAGRVKQTVTLASGDTLWAIAQKYGVSVEEIKRWNGIRNHRSLQAGAEIAVYLPKDKPLPAATSPAPAAVMTVASVDLKGMTSYTVKKGDTVWDIARSHDVDPMALLKDNNLSRRSKIKPGDVLSIRLASSSDK